MSDRNLSDVGLDVGSDVGSNIGSEVQHSMPWSLLKIAMIFKTFFKMYSIGHIPAGSVSSDNIYWIVSLTCKIALFKVTFLTASRRESFHLG